LEERGRILDPHAVMIGLVPGIQPNASAFGDVVKPPESFGLAGTGTGTAWMAWTSPAMTEAPTVSVAKRPGPRRLGKARSAPARVRTPLIRDLILE
jgi:hypothetical protein